MAALPRRLIFVRHAVSEANESNEVRYSKPDHTVSISRRGVEQARQCAAPGSLLASLLERDAGAPRASRWVVSPFLRTQQTAAILRAELAARGVALSPGVLECPLLHERQYPNVSLGSYAPGAGWVGWTQDERERFMRAEQHVGFYFFRGPGSENSLDMGARCEALLQWLARAGLGADDTAVLVTHASTISDMCNWLLETPPHVSEATGTVGNCGVTVLHRAEAGGITNGADEGHIPRTNRHVEREAAVNRAAK